MKYDNVSIDKKVGFIEKYHKYEMIEGDPIDFNSVTTIIKNFHEEFDADAVIKNIINNPKSPYYNGDPEEIKKAWSEKGAKASAEGTLLHAYGEALLNKLRVKDIPNLPKAVWIPEIVQDLQDRGYELAKTEILLYSEILKLAGQSDIVLKKKREKEEYDYMIYDWKFLGSPIKKNSFFNANTRKFKMMLGPFKHLQDCNYIHYSIQLALYQTLMGAPEKVKEKVLVCVYNDSWEYVPTYPMRVFWDDELKLQAVYELKNGRVYDSRTDSFSKTWPKDIVGR